MKTMKFGGGCLATGNNFLGVVDIVKAEKEKTIIVVSAISGVTDMLVRGIIQSIQNEKKVAEIIAAISDMHYAIMEEVINDKDIFKETWDEIISRQKKLERLLYGVAYTEEITSSLRALILSYGERFCVHILAGVLKDKGIAAKAMEADEIGIITDDFFEHATALLPEVKE